MWVQHDDMSLLRANIPALQSAPEDGVFHFFRDCGVEKQAVGLVLLFLRNGCLPNNAFATDAVHNGWLRMAALYMGGVSGLEEYLITQEGSRAPKLSDTHTHAPQKPPPNESMMDDSNSDSDSNSNSDSDSNSNSDSDSAGELDSLRPSMPASGARATTTVSFFLDFELGSRPVGTSALLSIGSGVLSNANGLVVLTTHKSCNVSYSARDRADAVACRSEDDVLSVGKRHRLWVHHREEDVTITLDGKRVAGRYLCSLLTETWRWLGIGVAVPALGFSIHCKDLTVHKCVVWGRDVEFDDSATGGVIAQQDGTGLLRTAL